MSDISSGHFGIYQGSVSNTNDPLKQGRIRAYVPMVHADDLSPWITPVLDTLVKPKVGSVVYVMYLNGDAAFPVYFPVPKIVRNAIEDGAVNHDKLSADVNNDIADGLVEPSS